MTADTNTWAGFVRAQRKALRLSQRSFARHIGFSSTAVNYWENGKVESPEYPSLQQFAAKLEIHLADVLAAAGFDGEPEDQPAHGFAEGSTRYSELPEWAILITRLSSRDRRIVQRMVEDMAVNPVNPD